VKKAEVNEQHKNIIQTLRVAAFTSWKFENINLIVGKCGFVAGNDFNTKLITIGLHEGMKDNIFADHATQTIM